MTFPTRTQRPMTLNPSSSTATCSESTLYEVLIRDVCTSRVRKRVSCGCGKDLSDDRNRSTDKTGLTCPVSEQCGNVRLGSTFSLYCTLTCAAPM